MFSSEVYGVLTFSALLGVEQAWTSVLNLTVSLSEEVYLSCLSLVVYFFWHPGQAFGRENMMMMMMPNKFPIRQQLGGWYPA